MSVRMALDIVEGYVIDVFKPWCHQFGRLGAIVNNILLLTLAIFRSEPVFYSLMRNKQLLMKDSVG